MSNMQMGKSIENRIRTGDFTVAAAETHASSTAVTLKELLKEVPALELTPSQICLLYTSDAADERVRV